MALKATIYKAQLQIADMDRNVYGDHNLTLACHPSENEERLLIRLLAYALNVPQDDKDGALEFTRGLSEPDEPELWQKDLTGAIRHWIDIGQPADERRLIRASGRAEKVSVYAFASSVPVWWSGIATKLTRAQNLHVWQVPADQSQALAALAKRGMQWQVTVQDGTVWVNDGQASVEITPVRLMGN